LSQEKIPTHIDTLQHFVREWVEEDILKITITPTLNKSADIFTKNTTEEIVSTHSVKLVKPTPKQGEMYNIICFPNESMIPEPTSNEWIKVMKRKKKERFTSKPTLHNREYHPRIQMKKGTTR
jgi:hypothetical protein